MLETNLSNPLLRAVRRNPIAAVFLAAIVLRVLFIVLSPIPDQVGGDFPLYQRIADNILEYGNFGDEPQKTYGSPSISPGWAFFLAGYEFFFGKSKLALLAASVVLGGMLAAGMYLFARLFLNARVALIAGLLGAAWPAFLIQTLQYGSSLLLYTTVLFWGILVFSLAIHRQRWLFAMISGALIGFAALVDAIAFFIPLVLVVWVLLTQRSWKMAMLVFVFIAASGLVVAPWMYRNVIVAEQLGIEERPAISKGELEQLSPQRLFLMTRLIYTDRALLSGLSKMYVFPYDISALDPRTVENEMQRASLSYKEKLFQLLSGGNVSFSDRERAVLIVKIVITLLHWLLLAFAAAALVFLLRTRRWSLPLLVLLLVGYVTAAVIGFGSLAQDDFQSISGPNSFVFPMLPFLIILASLSIQRLHTHLSTRASAV